MESCGIDKSFISKYYKHLSKLIVTTITQTWYTKEHWIKHTHISGYNIQVVTGSPRIILASHLDNWEIGITNLPLKVQTNIYGIYKPISTRWVDNWIYRVRSRFGLKLCPMEHVAKQIIKDKSGVYIFINDQSPPTFGKGQWVNFMGRNTLWYDGCQRIGKKFDALYYYMSVKQKGADIYIDFRKVDSDNVIPEYVAYLEQDIRSRPESWLWSHNRWKHVEK